MAELTFGMIKPDAVSACSSGLVIAAIEENGFHINRMHKVMLSESTARAFYAVHLERPFFGELIEFIISGPVILLALERDNAVKAWRDLMGPTDPADAEEGTMRKLFGTSIGCNAVHGSDGPDTAIQELTLFFPDLLKGTKYQER